MARPPGCRSASPALVETDLVVTVTAAETVLHGGPAALLARRIARGAARRRRDLAARDAPRRRAGRSRASSSGSWRRGSRSTASRSCSTCRDVFGGYPYEEQILERIARSKARRALGLLPAAIRGSLIERVPRELTAAAVFGGTPSAAHAEALLRAIEFKGATLDEPLDAIVIGIPPTTPFLPRERPNPVSRRLPRARARAAPLARTRSRSKPGGTAILLHDFQRRFPAPDADALPRALRRPADGPRPRRAARRRAGGARRHARDRRLPRRARGASARAVPRLERLRRGAQPPRAGAHRRLPRRARRPAARLRAGARRRRGARDGARRAAPSGSASCSRRRTSRWWSSPAPAKSP